MMNTYSPWLKRVATCWLDGCWQPWADTVCLNEHFDIGAADRIRFVRGHNREALSLGECTDRRKRFVSDHRNKQLDGLLAMTGPFDDWFGPGPGRVWVEINCTGPVAARRVRE